MSDPDYPQLFLDGIRFFNECEFFESHEAWEDLWTDDQTESRKFYQGLIQAAVALHHFGNGNLRGARKLNLSCRRYLDPYRPTHMGLDLDNFLSELDECFREVVASDELLTGIEIDPDRIPEIHLDPAPSA
jgi:predicted metal-dependent hydrolase